MSDSIDGKWGYSYDKEMYFGDFDTKESTLQFASKFLAKAEGGE